MMKVVFLYVCVKGGEECYDMKNYMEEVYFHSNWFTPSFLGFWDVGDI